MTLVRPSSITFFDFFFSWWNLWDQNNRLRGYNLDFKHFLHNGVKFWHTLLVLTVKIPNDLIRNEGKFQTFPSDRHPTVSQWGLELDILTMMMLLALSYCTLRSQWPDRVTILIGVALLLSLERSELLNSVTPQACE